MTTPADCRHWYPALAHEEAMTTPTAAEVLAGAIEVALSVALHERADPSCSGQPPYTDTQADAKALAAFVVRQPIWKNAIADTIQPANQPQDSLDAAWKAAEDALPEEWSLTMLERIDDFWVARAEHPDSGLVEGAVLDAQGQGPTPVAALLALAEQLEGTRSE